MKWSPIITDGDAKEFILTRINSIASDLISSSSKYPSLIENNAGLSIFWEYFFLYSENKMHYYNAVKLIKSSLNSIADTPMSYNFSVGVAGILWSYSHLANSRLIAVDLGHAIGDNINKFLVDSSKFDIQHSNYDYLHGGLSTLPYFLERMDNNYCRKCIDEIITELAKSAETLPNGITVSNRPSTS